MADKPRKLKLNFAFLRPHYWLCLVILLTLPTVGFSQTIESIQIKGNRKIERAAIEEKLKNKKGKPLNLSHVKDEVKALFNTGYFQDVQVEDFPGKKGGVKLVYTLKEKPSVTYIDYKGNSELDNDELGELTKLKPFEIIDYGKITKGVSEIQKAYEEKGYYLAKVTYEVSKDPKGSGVKVVFNVEENDQVLVKRVSFLGNNKVPESDLKARMLTQEGGFFSGVSGSGTFKKDAFEQDVQLISFLYFNKGYVKAKVSRPEVTVTPDKKGIYITIRVEEGEQFNTGDVSFSGDLLFSSEELMETAKIDESEIFVYEVVQSDIRDLTAKYGDLGYAYTNVIPRTFIRDKERKVDIVYEFDKGNKVYFGTINVIGNSRTRDKVVRRELRIGEGELYNETRKRESIDNVRRLGYFEQVQFNSKTPKDRDDLMDIDIVVKERNTGSFQVGAGYSSFSGMILNAQLNQSNFLGRGHTVGLQIDYSALQKRYRVNFTEPYFYDTLWSVGFDIFRNDNNIPNLFREKVEGAAVRVGHPVFNRYLYAFLRYKVDNTTIENSGFPGQYPTDVFKAETVNGSSSSVTASLEYDKRNDRFAPSKGIHTSMSYEMAGLGGSLVYNKGDAFFRWYQNLFWNVVLRTNFSYGFVTGPGDREIPFTKRYRLGGPYNLRGFDFSEIGKTQFSPLHEAYLKRPTNDPNGGGGITDAALAARRANVVLGGRQQALAMIEFEFPLVKEAGIRGVAFYDIGVAEDTIVESDMREDVGFGVRWFSPIGPLRFEWGFPLDRRAELQEEGSEFHFAIGAPF